MFQDNFDYGHIRRDFVHGVLTSDLLMKNIYTHVAKDEYAARVQDTKSYDAIRSADFRVLPLLRLTFSALSKDILSRWTFPLVPDNNHPSSHAYEHRRGNKYFPRDNTVVLSRYVSCHHTVVYSQILGHARSARTHLLVRILKYLTMLSSHPLSLGDGARYIPETRLPTHISSMIRPSRPIVSSQIASSGAWSTSRRVQRSRKGA